MGGRLDHLSHVLSFFSPYLFFDASLQRELLVSFGLVHNNNSNDNTPSVSSQQEQDELHTKFFAALSVLTLLAVPTIFYFCSLVYRLIRFVVVHFLRRPHDLRIRYDGADVSKLSPKQRGWCVVTGGSQGCGRALACEFAKLGFNILIFSRSENNLAEAKKLIREASLETLSEPVEVRTVSIDFSESSSPEFWTERFFPHVRDLDVAILCANVGLNSSGELCSLSEKKLLDFINVNCTSQLLAIRQLLPQMRRRCFADHQEHFNSCDKQKVKTTSHSALGAALDAAAAASGKKEGDGAAGAPLQLPMKRSAIITMSSVAGVRPAPLMAPYSATKSFNDLLSRSLALEVGDCVDVLSVRSGYVATAMSQIAESDAGGFVLRPPEFAKGVLDKLGFVSETFGDIRHATYGRTYVDWIPDWLLVRIRQQRLAAKRKAGGPSVSQPVSCE